MKSLAICVFLFLIVPGSGQLLFDGIPLSTRTEFAALVLFSIAILNRELRQNLRSRLEISRWRGAIFGLAGLLMMLKLLTFAWLPFSDGFAACYRSLYLPVADSESCEKSYEGPFLRGGFVIDNATRVERTIDFGTHFHDWSLPFMNEYPRLGALWLERFPFTAQYGAVLRNTSNERRFVPIYGNGEMSGRAGTIDFGNEGIPLVDRYEFPRLTIIDVPSGVSEFVLNYRFSDDDASQPPDEKPPVRGPYATLKVGPPQSRESLLNFTQVRVRGWALDTAKKITPEYFVAIDSSGDELSRSAPQERPDVAAYVGLPDLTSNGFNLAFPSRALLRGNVKIKAVYASASTVIGEILGSDQVIPGLPSTRLLSDNGQRSDFQLWFDADRGSFSAWAPQYEGHIGLSLRVLLLLLDGVSLLILGGLFLALLAALRSTLPIALALGAAAFTVVELGVGTAPEIMGSPLFLPLLTIVTLVSIVGRRFGAHGFFLYLPMATVLAAHKSFDYLQRFSTGNGERWWGRLLFYARDSDWFATQGYARTVFLEGSLRGGESLFWFQAGPRYLAFLTRTLLGENDALVGILMTTLGFFSILVLYACSQSLLRGISLRVIAAITFFVLMFFMSDDLMAGFGFVGSSEYPTWIALFLITGFIITTQSESRSWPMVAISIVLGYSIQLRPNQIGGVVLVFVAILALVDRSDVAKALSTISKMVVAFISVVAFSLIHNLYYGESFVPFTANAGINYAFSWRDVLGLDAGAAGWSVVWAQARYMMYWNSIGNYSWALMFWGSQFVWVGVVVYRLRHRLAMKVQSLYLLIPFGYALPMLKYQMGSYYPRHLVAINLSFLCAALMAWPRDDTQSAAAPTEQLLSAASR